MPRYCRLLTIYNLEILIHTSTLKHGELPNTSYEATHNRIEFQTEHIFSLAILWRDKFQKDRDAGGRRALSSAHGAPELCAGTNVPTPKCPPLLAQTLIDTSYRKIPSDLHLKLSSSLRRLIHWSNCNSGLLPTLFVSKLSCDDCALTWRENEWEN